jgi:hypothetical protein
MGFKVGFAEVKDSSGGMEQAGRSKEVFEA